MPLGPAGREVKAKMANTYGSEKGKQVFYASMHKKPKFAKAMHKGARTGRKMSSR